MMAGGTVLDLMVFNIWRGGNLGRVDTHGFAGQNRDELLTFFEHERADLIFLVETYGLGRRVEAALNHDPADGRRFRGVQVTREPGQDVDGDNLWLFTWLPVEEIYPIVSEPPVTSFHFGGARLTLPAGGHIHALAVWLSHITSSWEPLNQTVLESALGVERSCTNDDVVETDHVRRLDMAKIILGERLPRYVRDDAPVLLGGDFNTQSHLDWTEATADAPRHEGLVLEWPVMKMFADAGFTDTFRAAHPDVARYPGRTWAAGHSFMYAPLRLDYLLARGNVRVLASATRTRRLPQHQSSDLDDLYPFYSDHGAVLSRLWFEGDRPGYSPAHPPVDEPETSAWPGIPEPPVGLPVRASEITAHASSSARDHEPALAVDGNPRTHWHSHTGPGVPDPHPHHLTLVLGRERTLTAVRYQPPIDSYRGIVTRYTYLVSTDGTDFQPVASGTWTRDSLPKDVTLPKVRAQYLRLTAEAGVAGRSAVAELAPYEQPASSADAH